MKENHVKRKHYFIGALALFVIACMCAVFMFANASFANSGEDQATSDNQEITNDAETPTNDGAKYAYIAGSGIGGVIDQDKLSLYWMTDDIYNIAVEKSSDNNRFCVILYDSGKNEKSRTYIYLDEYGRFSDIIFYGPAYINQEGEIVQNPIEIYTEGEDPIYNEFKFSDYQFTYQDEEGNNDYYNYLEFVPIGENYFGGTIGGKEGHDKIDLSLSRYIENPEDPDHSWQEFTIEELIEKIDPSGLLWYIFKTFMYPTYPQYIEDYQFSSKSIIVGRPCFIDNDGEAAMLVSVDDSEATVNVRAYPKEGYVFDHWELNGEPLKNGYSITVPPPKENHFTIAGVEYTYYTYEMYACYRDVNDCLVTFNSQGGTEVNPQTVHKGNLATEPVTPVKSGYTFGGWFTQPAGHGQKFNFATTPITEDITLYAYWVNGPIVPPVITGGEGSVFEHGSASPMTFTVDGLEYLTNVKVDSGIIDPKWYMCSNSLVEISLLPEYLNKLYPGEHTFTVVTSTGEAETTFNIHDTAYNPVNPDNPGEFINGNANAKTGDSLALIILGIVAVMLLAGSSFYFRKKQN